MTCRLLIRSGEHGQILDYWVAAREGCLEMADLWRFGGFLVWMEAW